MQDNYNQNREGVTAKKTMISMEWQWPLNDHVLKYKYTSKSPMVNHV